MLAIMHALEKWRQYLLGSRFEVKTDHKSLKHLLKQETLTDEQRKWVDKIQAFDFEITYKKGKENIVADALSRKYEDIEFNTMTAIEPEWLKSLHEEYSKNQDVVKLLEDINKNKKDNKWKIKNGTIMYKDRIYLNKEGEFVKRALDEGHNVPGAGHVGNKKTYMNVRRNFFWKGMKADVEQHVAECDTCQRQKSENIPTPGTLQPLNIPQQKWEEISMDFITGLPLSEGKDAIWVVVDRLTKYGHFIPISMKSKVPQLAELFMKEIYKYHGFPKRITCDRDPRFTSKFWQEVFRLTGSKFNMSTAYHPQTDGQTEVVNKCLEGYLRCYVGDKQSQWCKWVHLAEQWYNTAYHTSIKMSPFRALYGYEPPSLKDQLFQTSRVPAAQELVQKSKEIIKMLKDNLDTARNRMKQQADKKRFE